MTELLSNEINWPSKKEQGTELKEGQWEQID